MEDKKRYYALDDIGFIGDQSRTEAQRRKDAKKTALIFQAMRAGRKPFRRPVKRLPLKK
jgi:hypothetical protein